MYSLEQTINMDSLYRAWHRVSSKNTCGGLDGVELSFYRSDLQKNLRSLQTSILTGNYRPYTQKNYYFKDRAIFISCVDDKIVQTALSEAVITAYTPAKSVHGFIRKRSVFTAKRTLDNALTNGVSEYIKVDIKRFYDSIDRDILLGKVTLLFTDTKLLELIELLVYAHSPGVSTGSCLSPALSNLYLADFDRSIEERSVFYARYVDDMLVAPISNIALISEKLAEVNLEINSEKSEHVKAADGFRYLGFDIKRDIDAAIQNGNFALAEKIYDTQECDIISDKPPIPEKSHEPATLQRTEYELPNTVSNVIKKCHIIRSIVEKAKTEHCLSYPEKTQLLQIFHCLGEGGAKLIHHVLSHCDDYDFAETQRRINRYGANNPLGCKKLCEQFGDNSQCSCNFTAEKIYPTPIIHALRVDRECFKPSEPKDNIGHFKARNPKDKAVDALSAIIELNKKQYEVSEQQKILKGQIEDLFERTDTREFQMPQGILIKTDDGIFIKVG
jgi:hypothetical protein